MEPEQRECTEDRKGQFSPHHETWSRFCQRDSMTYGERGGVDGVALARYPSDPERGEGEERCEEHGAGDGDGDVLRRLRGRKGGESTWSRVRIAVGDGGSGVRSRGACAGERRRVRALVIASNGHRSCFLGNSERERDQSDPVVHKRPRNCAFSTASRYLCTPGRAFSSECHAKALGEQNINNRMPIRRAPGLYTTHRQSIAAASTASRHHITPHRHPPPHVRLQITVIDIHPHHPSPSESPLPAHAHHTSDQNLSFSPVSSIISIHLFKRTSNPTSGISGSVRRSAADQTISRHSCNARATLQ